MSRGADWPELVEGDWRDTHRLILATYASSTESYLTELADDPDDVELLVELRAATNTRLAAQRDRSTLAIGSDELVFDLDYSHIINAAFTYPGQGGRFHGRTRGAWYSALSIDTCLAEVTHHRRVLLAETDWWYDTVEYQDYVCAVGGRGFAELRDGDERAAVCLDPDSYVASQELAEGLLDRGAAGVVYPAVRHHGGTNLACFRPALLPPVREGGRHRLEFAGTSTATVSTLT